MKRLLDVLVSACGLLLLSPLLLAISLAVALGTRGPVVFRQQRIGRGFRPFTLYKFRTMTLGSERGLALTVAGDARVTRVGRLLRRTKLDELPQLVNVLKGDMSLVGPRPEVSKYVELFRAEYREVLSVPPGITDYATLAFQDEERVLRGYADPEQGYIREVLPAKLALSKQYLADRSLLTDLKILARTAHRVLGS